MNSSISEWWLTLSRPSVSSLKARTKALMSSKQKNQIIVDIEVGIRSIESNLHDGKTSKVSNSIPITNPLQGAVEYGRILEDVAKLLHYETLSSLEKILRSDALYLSGRKLDTLDISEKKKNEPSEEIENIVARLTQLEEWLGV